MTLSTSRLFASTHDFAGTSRQLLYRNTIHLDDLQKPVRFREEIRVHAKNGKEIPELLFPQAPDYILNSLARSCYWREAYGKSAG